MADIPKIPKLKSLQNSPESTKKIAKPVLMGVIAILLAAFGLEASNNDWDLGKLLSGSSPADAKVMRDIDGNVVNAGGPSEDVNRLDGDNDGLACETLPKTATK